MMSSTRMHIAVLFVSFCSVSYGSPFERAGGQCLTIGGAQVGVPCVFPFKARGVTYTECTKAGGFATPWCSTKVDASGNTVLGNYGDCPASDYDCYPTTAAAGATTAAAGGATGPCVTTGGADVGKSCVFPFKARGVTYTSCTFAGGFSTPWCSTKVDASGNTVLGNWGDCPMNDPTCPNDAVTTAAAPAETTAAATGPCLTNGGADVGKSCVFPFKARGVTYTSCTFAGGFSTPWCSTKVDASGNTVLGNWGDCPMNDPTCPNDAATTAAPTVAAETSPAETSPAETSPAETSPAETSPAETSPAETSPAETSPAETSPAETSPAETSPAETSPAETSPAETSPAETSPAETSPAETSLAETSPAETSPAETSPAETSPAETSPAETSPAETSPAETSPAETSSAAPTTESTTAEAALDGGAPIRGRNLF